MNVLLILLLIFLSAFQCKKDIPDSNPKITSIELIQKRVPLFIGQTTTFLSLKINSDSDGKPLVLSEVKLKFAAESQLDGIESITVKHSSTNPGSKEDIFGKTSFKGESAVLKINTEMGDGIHFVWFDIALKSNCDLSDSFILSEVNLSFSNHEEITAKPEKQFTCRPAIVVRAQGQDNCDTYRIPGLITTNSGALIAVYDNRYNNSKDLQEDIDIGMSRSTDGGQTWQPMRVIMDMGEYGGRSQRLNGIGDPCVLYDHKTNTIWVAALWMSGANEKDMLWWASKPGMKPDETGQFILVKSTDDGKTWSQPINITSQIKDPAWQLLLQGPGQGITLKDGTLVFPAQFKADIGVKSLDGGQYTCHSTIVYSKDNGNSWQIGTGAKTNTTESQVVQLADGSLMLNMRDDRNRKDKGETNGRAVAITRDLGKTWQIHPSSNAALPESNCMASLISAKVKINETVRQVLFFSNPANKTERKDMTIKASLNQGVTWLEKYQVLLNESTGYGYSCLTRVDENTLGILYEGEKALYFQKIKIIELFQN